LKKITKINKNNICYTFLDIPNSNIFKYEVVQKIGALVEHESDKLFPELNKNIFGISHLIEHMCFKATKNLSSNEIIDYLKKYGVYNASTSHDRVNYWYKTNSDNIDKAINIVNEIAFNDLLNVSVDEFLIERDTVFNECSTYMNDNQSKFHFNSNSHAFNLPLNDNVLGSLDDISSLSLDDCILVKKFFNTSGKQAINVTFDSNSIDIDSLCSLIDSSLSTIDFTPLNPTMVDIYDSYASSVKLIEPTDITIQNNSDKTLFSSFFSIPYDRRLISYALDFLNNFSKHSLFDEVREKRGLTYNIHFGQSRLAYSDFYEISCDIIPGNENLLISSIKESFQKTSDLFSNIDSPELISIVSDFIKSKKINRHIKLMNLNNYESIIWSSHEIPLFDNIFNGKKIYSNIDDYFSSLDDKILNDILVLKYIINDINDIIQNNQTINIWSKKDLDE
jgi:predicted Zn-dependent peptidase